MACIDKTYVNKKQLIEAIDWCKSIGEVTLENGYKFHPLDFIRGYNDIDDAEFFKSDRDGFVLWNTPTWFDRWLWKNCPLLFVRERLQEQYGEDNLERFENWVYIKPERRKQHYTFLEVPVGEWKWLAKQSFYECRVSVPNEHFHRRFDAQSKQWYKPFDMLPCDDDYIWREHHKNIPTKKSIIRQLNKWDLPKGAIVEINNFRYRGMDFKILVK